VQGTDHPGAGLLASPPDRVKPRSPVAIATLELQRGAKDRLDITASSLGITIWR
jgi:hypothetical protein